MNLMEDWVQLPDHVLLQIFRYLKAEVWIKEEFYYFLRITSDFHEFQDLLNVSTVSRDWYRVSKDELLWKSLFKRDWNINPKIGIAPGIFAKLFAHS